MSQLAKRFDVSQGWAKKISAALRATGKVERTPGGPRGRTSKLTPAVRQDLRSWIGEQSDLTLAELRDRLYQQQRIQVGSTQLWTVLKAMGVRLKKSRSTPPSKTRRPVSSHAVSGGTKRAGSIHRS